MSEEMLPPREVRFVEWLRALQQGDAHARREDAGHQGAHNDGGAGRILSQHGAWSDGLICGLTKEPLNTLIFAEQVERFKKETDPEWETYQRLKGKFE